MNMVRMPMGSRTPLCLHVKWQLTVSDMQKFNWFKVIFTKISGTNTVKCVSVIL